MERNRSSGVEAEAAKGMVRALLCLGASLAVAGSAGAQTSLPLIADADFQDLRSQCKRLLERMDALKAPLLADKAKGLEVLLKDGGTDAEAAALEIQKVLDPLCLVAVSINPESR